MKASIVSSDGATSNHTVALFTAETTPWNENILTYLTDKGYQLSTITSLEGKQDHVNKQSVDAIISLTPATDLEFFRLVHDSSTPENHLRPLLVLITDDFEGNLPYEWADIILPPNPKYIDYQLRTVLRLRNENTTLSQKITELNEQLKTQQESTNAVEVLKNAIVRNVSHELKTPLLQVKSAVALLAEDSKEADLIDYATGATARLETLVKNITLLGSSLDVNPGPVIVRDAVEYARRNIRRIWEHRNSMNRIELHVEANLPPVLADKQGLSTVLQLLIDNGLKFSEKNVDVYVESLDKEIKITIRDYGIGIAQNQLDSIFDIFYQIDPSSTRRYGGTGVGLAIVKLILDRHDCTIHVLSQENKGSKFWFNLPIFEL